MPSYSKYDVILVRYSFSDLSSSKVRPAVVVSTSHPSQDILITPLTSKTGSIDEDAYPHYNALLSRLNSFCNALELSYEYKPSNTVVTKTGYEL